jgi:1-phosphatidylinositol-4-phosphate 5-kinase
MVFQRIRSRFGINQDDYLRSVGPEQLLGNMILGNLSSLSELSSEGKSGSFFYYTADGKYMMKTISEKEHALLKTMLKQYFDHLMQNPGTLLVRFLGLHGLRLQKRMKGSKSFRRSTRKIYFIVMGNMFNTPFDIQRRYDLKGSWVGRQTPDASHDPSVALKDVDFKEAEVRMRIGKDRRLQLITQMESDTKFLRDNNIIDYSLLLGIHEADSSITEDDDPEVIPQGSNEAERSVQTGRWRKSDFFSAGMPESALPVHQSDMGGMLSSDRKSLYYLGIIDILTPYDTHKKVEHIVKALRYDRRGVSCCPPPMYAERFLRFMQDNAFD